MPSVWVAFIQETHRGFTTDKFIGVFSTKELALDAAEEAACSSGSSATPTDVYRYVVDKGPRGYSFDWRNRD